MITRHTLSLALLTAFAGAAAPYDAYAESMKGWTPPGATSAKAAERRPFYVRHSRGRGAEVAAAVRGQGGEVTHDLGDFDTFAVLLPEAAVEALSHNKNVTLVEPVPEHKLQGQVVPWNIDQFQARDIWDKDRDGNVDPGEPNGSGLKFCIIDTGFFYDIDGAGPDTGHDDFVGITANGISQITGEQWHFDGNGHGTHVAGTANAVNNNIGVVGVMPGGAELFIVKIFNNSGVWVAGQSNLGAAAQACRDAGANVLSMSLGGGSSATEEAIFQGLYDTNNILNIAAAGNDGNNVASYPASYESVVSVGAIDETELAADFTQFPVSAYGVPTNTSPRLNTEWDVVELAGGGVNVLSTVPAPNASVPNYVAIANGVTYSGARIEGSALGNVTQNMVSGGLCDTTNVAWNGRVVLCQRGTVTFAAKVNNVRNSGGVAALLYNNVAGGFAGTCLDANSVNQCTQPSIPALSLSQADGQTLLAGAIGTPTQVIVDDGSSCTTCNGGYDYYSGTSMATPGVAAAVGFIWELCGGPTTVTNKQIRQLLRDTAKDLSGTQPGTGQVYGPGWDRVTGWGLVQLKDALDLGNTRFGAVCPILLEVAPSQRELCTASTDSTTFGVTLDDRFTGSATLSASGLPAGTSGSYSPNPIVHPTKLSNYTLSGLTGKSGVFTLQFNAVDNGAPSNTAQGFAVLNAYGSAPTAPAPSLPANGATGVALAPTLSWAALADVQSYTVEVSTSPTFATIAASATTQATSHTLATPLAANTTYHWRVRATNPCGGGGNSATRSFTTVNLVCQTIASTDVPKAIADATNPGPTPGVTNSTLVSGLTGTIADVNVVNLAGTHSFINDLTFDLISPAATTVRVMNQSCASENNFGLNLDDEAAAGAWPCPPVGGGTYRPSNPLSGFDGQAANGTWTLRIRDVARMDTGSLTTWGLQICAAPPAGNQAPVAVNDSIAVNEGATATALVGGATSVRANDTDAEDGTPTGNVLVGTSPTNGSLTLNTNGTFSYVHNGGETTTDSFTYTVRDSAGAVSAPGTVSITITAQNDAPVAIADAITVAEGGTATTLVGGATSVRANDTDAEDGTPTGNVLVGTSPVNGSLTLNTNGTFSYVHNGGETTSDSFTYNVRDGAGAVSNTVTVSITITAQNDAPVAIADAITVAEGGTATTLVGGATSVRANDTDAEDGTPTGNVLVGTSPVNGSLTLNTNGTFSYVHDGGETTSDSFTYNVRDGAGAVSNTVTVSITITAQNDAPVAIADAITVAEGGTATTLVGGATSVRANDTDAEDGTPTGNVLVGTSPVNGSLTLNTNGTFSYVHNGGETTSDSFTYNVRDGAGAVSNTVAVSITITAQNDAPVAIADAITVAEGGTATTLVGGNTSVRANDTDAEDGTPTGNVLVGTSPVNGSLTLNTDGTFSYVHDGGETTSDSFTYNVRDGAGAVSNTVTVSITITAQNDAPVAVADAITVAEGGTATTLVGGNTSVRQNDTDAESGTPTGNVVQVAAPANGSLTLNTDGTFSYVHDGGETTSDSFTYNVRDGAGAVSNTVAVSITITAQNDAPVAIADAITVAEGGTATTLVGGNTSVRQNDTDAESGTPTGNVVQVAAPANGSLTLNTDGTFSYVHDGGETTSDSFTYNVRDGAGAVSNTVAVSITITAQNDAPVAIADAITVAEGGTATTLVGGNTSVRQNDTDAESGTPTGNVVQVAAPANGSLTLNTDGTFSYVHDGGETTSDSFTYNVRDGAGAVSNTVAVSITITAQNDAPVAIADAITVAEGGTATTLVGGATSVRANDTDAEDGTPTGNVLVGTSPVNGSLTLNTNGTFSYVHNGGETTSDSFTYNVRDGAGAVSNTVTVSIAIGSANDAPAAVGTIADQTGTENVAVTPLATAVAFSDADGDTLTFSAAGLPPGLSIDTGTGVVSGTPTFAAAGSHAVTITARDPSNATATQDFDWIIAGSNQGPAAVGTIADQNGTENVAVTPLATAVAFSDADGDTLTFSAAGLPPGLSIDTGTGVVSGTPTFAAAGSHAVTITARDPSNATATQDFDWIIAGSNQGPAAVGTIADQNGTENVAVTPLATAVAFSDADGDTLTFSATGLPPGLSIDTGTGVVSGTPTFAAAGSHAVTITARDPSNATATQDFDWIIAGSNQGPAAVGTIADQNGSENVAVTPLATAVAFSDADGDTLTFSAAGLPPGLSIDTGTGVVSGTPTFAAAGSHAVTITARDPSNATATQDFDWIIAGSNQGPAAVGTIADQNGTENVAVTPLATAVAFSDADGDTLTFSATGLPPGLSIDTGTGVVSGTPTFAAAGSHAVTITARDPSNATATQDFDWIIAGSNQGPAAVGTIADQNGTENVAVTPLATAVAFSDADGDTLTFSATGLPPGLSIDTGTGVVSGTPTFAAAGSHAVTITARDPSNATATQDFDWIIAGSNQGPAAVGTIADQNGTENVAVTPLATAVAFSDADGDTLTFSATGLPPGLSIDTGTGVVSGTPTFAAAGSHAVTITARDPSNATATQDFDWIIAGSNQGPAAVGTIADQNGTENVAVTPLATAVAFSDADGDVLVYSAQGLPAGLSIDPFSGVISGTPTFAAAGTHAVTVTARDPSNAAATREFDWTIANTNRAPVVVNEPYAFTITDNASVGAAVGTISGNDLDGDALGFSITGGNTNNAFAINPTTGAITVATGGALVGGTQVTLTVRVADAGGLDDTTTVTITVQSSGPVDDHLFGNGFEGN